MGEGEDEDEDEWAARTEKAFKLSRIAKATTLDLDYASNLREIDTLETLSDELRAEIKTQVVAGKPLEQLLEQARNLEQRRSLCLAELEARASILIGLITAKLASGALTPPAAIELADDVGVGPLIRTIDYFHWDPMVAETWSLAMTVAWIAWRTPRDVVDHWTRAVLGTQRFERRGGGWIIVDAPKVSLVDLRDRPTQGALVFGPSFNQRFSIDGAVQQLVLNLGEGKLTASGRKAGGRGRVLIDADDWDSLEIGQSVEGDALFFEGDKAPTFDHVALRRSEILEIWKDRASEHQLLEASSRRPRRKNVRSIMRRAASLQPGSASDRDAATVEFPPEGTGNTGPAAAAVSSGEEISPLEAQAGEKLNDPDLMVVKNASGRAVATTKGGSIELELRNPEPLGQKKLGRPPGSENWNSEIWINELLRQLRIRGEPDKSKVGWGSWREARAVVTQWFSDMHEEPTEPSDSTTRTWEKSARDRLPKKAKKSGQ